MLGNRDLISLLELARDEERRFAGRLSADERAAAGTLDRARAEGRARAYRGREGSDAQQRWSTRAKAGIPMTRTTEKRSSTHSRALPFDAVEHDAELAGGALIAEVERISPAVLATSPAWISEPTLGEEIVMYGVTHSLTHLFDPLCERGEAREALRMQQRYVDALPADASAELRAGARYNLGCLHARLGHDDDALLLIEQATALEPGLADLARTDPDLERLQLQLR